MGWDGCMMSEERWLDSRGVSCWWWIAWRRIQVRKFECEFREAANCNCNKIVVWNLLGI